MTLNEVEQAIRNLITNQPVVSSGPSGDVINNILSVINSYRNLKFLLQNHPAQDSFKFNAMNISQRAESELANAINQTLQERGINLMMYSQTTVNGFGMNPPTYNNYSMGQVPNMNGMGMNGQNMFGGQPQMPPMQQGGYQAPNGVQFNPQMPPPYQQPQPQFRPGPAPRPMMNGQVVRPGPQLYPRTSAPTQPIAFGDLEDEKKKPIKPKKAAFSIPKPVAKPTRVATQQSTKPANEPKVQRNAEPRKLQPDPEKKVEAPKKVVEPEPVVEEPVKEDKPDMVKATGRNYLLELLKK